ncbi:MAG: hypothetical protein Kow0065_23100 [Methylomicrobium sp.]
MIMRKSLFVLLCLAVLALGASYLSVFIDDDADSNDNGDRNTQKAVLSPPPLETLGQGARLPTADELQQEAQFNERQIALASQWLNGNDSKQRIIGAEQLSAFESPVSERYLVGALCCDVEPEVRLTAASSLAAFKRLSGSTITALIKALNDEQPKVRLAVLNLLTAYVYNNADSEQSESLLMQLKEQLHSGRLHHDTSDILQAFIDDSEAPTNAFFSPPR